MEAYLRVVLCPALSCQSPKTALVPLQQQGQRGAVPTPALGRHALHALKISSEKLLASSRPSMAKAVKYYAAATPAMFGQRCERCLPGLPPRPAIGQMGWHGPGKSISLRRRLAPIAETVDRALGDVEDHGAFQMDETDTSRNEGATSSTGPLPYMLP